MASGLRPPVKVNTETDYHKLADTINGLVKTDLMYAVGTKVGVCVVVVRGNVFRAAYLTLEPLASKGYQIIPDPENMMVYIK